MKVESKQSWIPIALVLVLFGILYYVFTGHQDPTPTQEMVAQKATESPDTAPTVAPTEANQQPDKPEQVDKGSGTAKRIRVGQDQTDEVRTPEKTAENPEIEWENNFIAENTLESALTGDIDDSIAVSELIGQCRSANLNEKSVQADLARKAQSVTKENPVPTPLLLGTGETMKFKTFADYENYVWTQFAECQSTRGMFDQSLRDRLAQMAESGNVNARYLYAMWVPVPKGSDEDQLIEWMTYQSLAMDFTWKNITEGEPLGMLAYGRSLEQVGHVYFTPVSQKYGPAFIMAAYKCGLDNHIVNRKVGNMTSSWQKRNMKMMLGRVESLSDKLAKTFCY
ncbi:hypothetical protein ACFL3I_13695 [Pseudomonadota bacterium]